DGRAGRAWLLYSLKREPSSRSPRKSGGGQAGALSQLGEKDQRQRHGNRTADAIGDLRERHQLHAVGRGQDRNVAGTALAAVAGIYDRRLDWVHAEPAPDKEPVAIKVATVTRKARAEIAS